MIIQNKHIDLIAEKLSNFYFIDEILMKVLKYTIDCELYSNFKND